MALIFTIAFFAAVFGIFRPYKFFDGAKRWHYGLAAGVLFVLIGVSAPSSENGATTGSKPATDSKANDEDTDKANNEVASTAGATPLWQYDEERDEMRDSVRKFAELESENSVDLRFPYGDQKAYITLRRDPQHGLDAMFRVRSGQILCRTFGRSYLNVKFDDGPIRQYNCTDSSDGSNEVAFIQGANGFISALKSAKRVVIEAEFYQNGRVQYVFNAEGLEWE